jgi:hypothetical protein
VQVGTCSDASVRRMSRYFGIQGHEAADSVDGVTLQLILHQMTQFMPMSNLTVAANPCGCLDAVSDSYHHAIQAFFT